MVPFELRKARPDRPSLVVKRPRTEEAPLVKNDTPRREYVLAGDYAKIEKLIWTRLVKIQQNPVKSVAKALIKRVEPYKQRFHPYTTSQGGKKKEKDIKARDSTAKRGVKGSRKGGKTNDDVPTTNLSPWWPKNVVWKGPDHIGRIGEVLQSARSTSKTNVVKAATLSWYIYFSCASRILSSIELALPKKIVTGAKTVKSITKSGPLYCRAR